MTPVDQLMSWMKRHEVADPAPICGLCFGRSGHPPLSDDGAPRCLPCIYARGRWAADPQALSEAALTALWDAHKDVLQLRHCRFHVLCWGFIGWTAEATLLDEAAAERALDAASHVAALEWARV